MHPRHRQTDFDRCLRNGDICRHEPRTNNPADNILNRFMGAYLPSRFFAPFERSDFGLIVVPHWLRTALIKVNETGGFVQQMPQDIGEFPG